ncbi:hypothetical protein EZV61_00665 [Corallincola luteus]|uniref:SPOR domain-containing protein n=1 Tax=Corallincola luteus TaxID=1775177 RepID=A0ABY2ANP8_9GAMM|nr:AAA family ATPase [Corallincola luteus]TCI04524.1 hypothetical protein EZV61_00665 [Corallincola luteus]
MQNVQHSEGELFVSQQQLHERLGFLVEFDSNIVLLKGSTGSGRSTTLLSYVTNHDTTTNHAFVQCQSDADVCHYRHQILTQLITNPLFDEADPLSDSLLRMLPDEPQRMLVVLDDCQFFSNEVWQEIAELIITFRRDGKHQLSVIGSIDSSANLSLASLVGDGVVEVAMPPLPMEERRHFLSELLAAEPSMLLNSEAIERHLALAKSPAAVMALATKIKGGGVKKTAFPWQHAVLAGLVTALLIALLLWEFQPSPDDASPRVEPPPVTERLPDDEKLSDQAIGEEVVKAPSVPAENPILSADELLPAELTEPPVEIEAAPSSGQNVVIEIPDELLIEAEQQNLLPVSPSVPPISTEESDGDESGAEETDPATVVPEASLDVTPETGEQKVVALPMTQEDAEVRQRISAWPTEHYTLQLGVFSDEAVLARFYQRAEIALLKDDILEYIVTKKGLPRHVLILGNFATRAEATAYLQASSADLRALKPWTKSVAAVKADITEAQGAARSE